MSTAAAVQLARLIAPTHARRGVAFDVTIEVGEQPEPADAEVEITLIEANGNRVQHRKRGRPNPTGEVSIQFTLTARVVGIATLEVTVRVGPYEETSSVEIDIG